MGTNEYIHHIFYQPNIFYYVVTEKQVIVHWIKKSILNKTLVFWDLDYKNIVSINKPKYIQNQSGSISGYVIEIVTYSKEHKDLHFTSSQLTASWDVYNALVNAYCNYLDRRKDHRAQIYLADLTENRINCSNCNKILSSFPNDIRYCPYCGHQLISRISS